MSSIEGRFVHGDNIYIDDYYLDEEWRHIQGYPGYMISNKGRVWSSKTNKILNKQI